MARDRLCHWPGSVSDREIPTQCSRLVFATPGRAATASVRLRGRYPHRPILGKTKNEKEGHLLYCRVACHGGLSPPVSTCPTGDTSVGLLLNELKDAIVGMWPTCRAQTDTPVVMKQKDGSLANPLAHALDKNYIGLQLHSILKIIRLAMPTITNKARLFYFVNCCARVCQIPRLLHQKLIDWSTEIEVHSDARTPILSSTRTNLRIARQIWEYMPFVLHAERNARLPSTDA